MMPPPQPAQTSTPQVPSTPAFPPKDFKVSSVIYSCINNTLPVSCIWVPS